MTNTDRLEAIEDALYHVGEAIDQINQVSGCEDIVAALEDRRSELVIERDKLERVEENHDRREMIAMTREYWRSVI